MLIKLTNTKHKEWILKTAREKQQITYKGNSICLTAYFSAETLQARREWEDIFKVLKGTNLHPRFQYLARLSFKIDGEMKSFFKQAKVKRIQYHPSSFTTKAKGTSSGRKHNRRERLTENKAKTIKKMVIGLYISIITLNVNGLNAPTKTGWRKICTCMHLHLPHHSAWPPTIICNYFTLLS